ncbi:sulfurtransferase complex subunit TusD [Pantoea sp. Mhis]|uniref:sulfurtransferase complex subunit TusD n=1 Tax=Pantoea sp. Mhis TaxID=2576759 RepID=UPI00135928EE|nr:sulfurtransferase complex subunit TusD [Pantoea sp. Mhis]MXP56538.1 sulfurtransferase complex subunit TusD [Pantoea sp. Mhis]
MKYTLLVTGPAYGTQHASSALLFARALLETEHELKSIFFYREGVLNANQLNVPVSDEFDMVRAWQELYLQYGVTLNICIASALRRGMMNIDDNKDIDFKLISNNLYSSFKMTGLRTLAKAILNSERLIQF